MSMLIWKKRQLGEVRMSLKLQPELLKDEEM